MNLIEKYDVDECVLSYSDVPYEYVMHLSAEVNAAGANFALLGPKHTMLKSSKPVIAVCATRTGTGKSQTSRKVAEILLAGHQGGSGAASHALWGSGGPEGAALFHHRGSG